MAFTATEADAVLKELYLPGLRNQLNDENWWTNQIESKSEGVEGRRALLALKVRRGVGVKNVASGGSFATAGSGPGTVNQIVPTYRVTGRFEIESWVVAKMKSDRGSFVRAMDLVMDDLKTTCGRDFNRQLWGDGTGAIATCKVSTTGQTTVLLADNTSASVFSQLYEGMPVDIGTAAEAAAQSGGATYGNAIVSIDETAKSIVLTSNLSTATDTSDFVFLAGNGGVVGSSQKELTGIQKIVDNTGSLHGVDPSTYGVWASTALSNSGTLRPISDDLLGQLMHKVQRKSGKRAGSNYVMAASDGVYRAYGATLTSQKRFATQEIKGGFSGIQVQAGDGAVTMMWEQDAPDSKVFYLCKDAFALYNETNDWEWFDDDGSILSRVANKPSLEGALIRISEQATDQRDAHGVLEDIQQ